MQLLKDDMMLHINQLRLQGGGGPGEGVGGGKGEGMGSDLFGIVDRLVVEEERTVS